MTTDEILKLFEDYGALLTGHFLLSSGLHSSRYLQSALVLAHPPVATMLGAELGSLLTKDPATGSVDFVISPALGGVVIGQEVARAMNVRALFSERQNGEMALRRGFRIEPGERAVVIEDVITTGGSTREVMKLVEKLGGKVVGVGSLIDRSGGAGDLGVPRKALAVLEVPTFDPSDCMLCHDGSVAIKPGSR